jgi:hypothetical protein
MKTRSERHRCRQTNMSRERQTGTDKNDQNRQTGKLKQEKKEEGGREGERERMTYRQTDKYNQRCTNRSKQRQTGKLKQEERERESHTYIHAHRQTDGRTGRNKLIYFFV